MKRLLQRANELRQQEAEPAFPVLVKPPEMHVDELNVLANAYTANMASVRSPEDAELAHELWAITMEEVEAGFLDGHQD